MNILIIGACGSGKTWVMKQILKERITKSQKLGLIHWRKFGNFAILGRYVGTMFDGSDKLSMAVAQDFQRLRSYTKSTNLNTIAEGDRFMNEKYISEMKPYIIRILDDGKTGRKKRNSKQTEQHLKRIQTRVNNTEPNIEVKNSSEALKIVNRLIDEHIKP